MKFSIIIPVYNAEKYIDKCLDSIIKQTYKNFEVIIINDGSFDNSMKIIHKYETKDKRFKCYSKKNGGLSDARNYGINYVKGNYLLFVDADDYIDIRLLENLSNISLTYDMVKFKIKVVSDKGKTIKEEESLKDSGDVSFIELCELEYFEPAWTYLYSVSFFKANKFKYPKDRVHEDFGLTPICLFQASKIYYLDYYGYYYTKKNNGIISDTNKERRFLDLLFHFDNLISYIDSFKEHGRKVSIFKDALARRIIYQTKIIPLNKVNDYIDDLRCINDYILEDKLISIIKKRLFRYFPKIYIVMLKIKCKEKFYEKDRQV